MIGHHGPQLLRDYLKDLPVGEVKHPRQVERLLAECWDDLDGCEGGMEAAKLLKRTKEMSWKPPYLSFRIERHGGIVLGSTRAEVQHWELDVEKQVASLVGTGRRQFYPMQAGLDVKPLAEKVAHLITQREEDCVLKWYEDGRVRVHVGKLIPDDAAKQTVTGRRKRFWKSLDELLAADWTRDGTQYKPRNTNLESKG